jgi:hypothetical protein
MWRFVGSVKSCFDRYWKGNLLFYILSKSRDSKNRLPALGRELLEINLWKGVTYGLCIGNAKPEEAPHQYVFGIEVGVCVFEICVNIIFANKDPECSTGGPTGLMLSCGQGTRDWRVGFDYLIKKGFDAG